MKILALDLSSPHGSVALLECGSMAVLLSESFPAGRGSKPGVLFQAIARAAREFAPVDTVVVGLGPGSYSGVRVSLAAATGFCLAAGRPVHGIPSPCGLDVGPGSFRWIGDARRESVYHARVEDERCIEGPELLTRDACHEKILSTPGLPVFCTEPVPGFPEAVAARISAGRLARAALARPDALSTDTGQPLEPLYLRPPHITRPKA